MYPQFCALSGAIRDRNSQEPDSAEQEIKKMQIHYIVIAAYMSHQYPMVEGKPNGLRVLSTAIDQ